LFALIDKNKLALTGLPYMTNVCDFLMTTKQPDRFAF